MKQKRNWMDSEQPESDEADGAAAAKADMKEQKSDSNKRQHLVFIRVLQQQCSAE